MEKAKAANIEVPVAVALQEAHAAGHEHGACAIAETIGIPSDIVVVHIAEQKEAAKKSWWARMWGG
jgi:hypothetical protein